MKSTNKNLFPIFEDIIQRKDKETLPSKVGDNIMFDFVISLVGK